MAFKLLPNVTHMGDTTNGAFATLIGCELQNGWAYAVLQKILWQDGNSYEGIGMIPLRIVYWRLPLICSHTSAKSDFRNQK